MSFFYTQKPIPLFRASLFPNLLFFNFMNRLLRLTKEAFFALWFYKNPLTYYIERLCWSRSQDISLFLRNGIRYALKSNASDINIVDELWNRKIYDRLISYIKEGSIVR